MSQRPTPPARTNKPTIRCAIYTRKSSEEGLEQEFNSLDAQREAAEAYVASQQHEGWQVLPTRYDDGGFSGGNMERPAVQRLMNDIAAGKIQCVVVYKVDRLSRSLLDFARMMSTFETHQVSFVSITQQFNTATSMGRLVLNVLLSFAQFEREIISERTRDKIAATRRKGQWSGGPPILGYDIDPRGAKIIVNEAEAERVRAIFQLYLDLGSLKSVLRELHARGWCNKSWITRKGKLHGGKPFRQSRLYALLTNVTLIGKITYKKEIHPGLHPAIVDLDLWQRVQNQLTKQRRRRGVVHSNRFGAILMGLLRCKACGCAMSPTATEQGVKRYRYYVCGRAQERGRKECPVPSLPARPIEEYVWQQVSSCFDNPALSHEQRIEITKLQPRWATMPACDQAKALQQLLDRVEFDGVAHSIALNFHQAEQPTEALSTPPSPPLTELEPACRS